MSPNRPHRIVSVMRHWCRPLTFLLSVALTASCGKDQPEQRIVTDRQRVAPMPGPTDSSTTVVQARWNPADGGAIYIPAEGGVAQVILPMVLDDSVPKPSDAVLPDGVAPVSVDLFAPFGRLGTVALGEFSRSAQPEGVEGCDAWPVVPLRESAGASPAGWRIALQAGVAEPLHADSIGGLSRSDSARLVVEINRAAALLPQDSAGVLGGIPFTVTKAYRLRYAGDVEAVIAVVERRLNMEAAPRTERTVLVLERPPGAKAFRAVWHDSQYATEDDLIAVDLLTVVIPRAAQRPTVFLGLDFGDGTRVEMLQRAENGSWALRWSSAYTGC